MNTAPLSFLVGDITEFDRQVLSLDDTRAYPTEEALRQLGLAVMTELLDLTANTGLEDFQSIIAEAVIGGFHSAAIRIEREADRARDDVSRLNRDFDGSEVADTELQDATLKARQRDVATKAVEFMRDEAASVYTVATGEVWPNAVPMSTRTMASPMRTSGMAAAGVCTKDGSASSCASGRAVHSWMPWLT